MIEPKQRIIQEAASMFLEEGIKSVRMDDIAARLGVSKRTIYEMFTDKNDLLEQSMLWFFEGKRNRLFEITQGAGNVFEEIFLILGALKPDEKLKTLTTNLHKFHPAIARKLDEAAHKFSDAEFDRLLTKGMAQGLLLPDVNKPLALITLTYTMTALFNQKHHWQTHDCMSMQMAFEYVLVNFFRGLASHRGIELIDRMVKQYRDKNQNQI